MLYEIGLGRPDCMIGITEPRRIATTTLANRINLEMFGKEKRIGDSVGY